MLISKNDLLFLILMCFFCSNMYLCKKVNQSDPNCSKSDNYLVGYLGPYNNNKWQGTTSYDLKDKNNKCCGNKTFLEDCMGVNGRCVYCCRRDMRTSDGLAYNTNPVPETKTYSNNHLLKCCSGKTLKDAEGRIFCCSSDVWINTKGMYYLKSGVPTAYWSGYEIKRDIKAEVKVKCQ
jgi:hypothetical protein